MNIPFLDLTKQYSSIKKEIDTAIEQVIFDNAFIGTSENKYVINFESNFAEFIGATYCVGCANGTDALELALMSSGVGKNDEVLVPANSWISTSETVSTVGATPVFVDIIPNLFTIDPSKLRNKITTKTKAIVPVHLYGLPANMNEIVAIAKEFDLIVIEDCAQAHGAKINGQPVGSLGEIATFSFFPGKNLGAYGDAGAIITNNKEIASKVKMLRNHGQLKKHVYKMEGRNSRLDGIQAAILDVKLKHLKKWNAERNRVASIYTQLLNTNNVKLPQIPEGFYHVFHLYVIRTENRDQLKSYLESKGIETSIHYPTPLPFLNVYEKYNLTDNDFPSVSLIKDQILSLPIYPEMNDEQIKYVANSINSFFE